MVESLVDDGFNRIVILGFDGLFQLGRFVHELPDVLFIRAAEGHHVHFFAVGPDHADFLADQDVLTLPDGDILRRGRCFWLAAARRRLMDEVAAVSARRIGFDLPGFFAGQGQRQRVVVGILEVFGHGAEIEQEEMLLLVFGVADAKSEQPGAASLDLDVLGGRKNGAHQADVEQVTAVVARAQHIHRNGDALGPLAVPKLLGDGGGIFNTAGNRNGDAGLNVVENLRQRCGVGLIHSKHDGLAEFAAGVFLRVFQERFAHQAVAARREDLPLQILNLEAFLLLVDDHRPTGFIQGLRRNVRAQVKDLRQAEERAFGVFHGVNDVIPEGRESGLAAEVVVGIAEQPRFRRFGVLLLQLLQVDVLQVSLGRGRQADASRLEELHDLSGIAVNGTVRLVVDDQIEMEGRELLAVAAVNHERLEGRHHDARAKQLARIAASRLVKHGFELSENDVELLKRLLRQLDAVNDEQNPLGVARDEEAANQSGTKEGFPGAGGHLQQKLAEAFVVEQGAEGVNRLNLIPANNQVGTKSLEPVGGDDLAHQGARRLEILEPQPFQVGP